MLILLFQLHQVLILFHIRFLQFLQPSLVLLLTRALHSTGHDVSILLALTAIQMHLQNNTRWWRGILNCVLDLKLVLRGETGCEVGLHQAFVKDRILHDLLQLGGLHIGQVTKLFIDLLLRGSVVRRERPVFELVLLPKLVRFNLHCRGKVWIFLPRQKLLGGFVRILDRIFDFLLIPLNVALLLHYFEQGKVLVDIGGGAMVSVWRGPGRNLVTYHF